MHPFTFTIHEDDPNYDDDAWTTIYSGGHDVDFAVVSVGETKYG